MLVSENESTMPELQKQAFDWLVLLRAEALDEGEIYAFADWLSRDHRHPEAFADAEDLLNDMIIAAGGSMQRMVGLNEADIPFAFPANPARQMYKVQQRKSRSRWFAVPLALAASWLFAVILVMPQHSQLMTDYFSDYYTGTGEFREVELSDGSRLLLNTNSAVSVNFSDAARRITLHHGQVRFTVAKDRTRPFEVSVDDLSVRALGTVFEVSSLDADESAVIVQEHAVSARIQPATHAEQSLTEQVKVQQGQILRHQNGKPLQSPESVELQQLTAWQNHQLVINDRPLNELITELNRYRTGRIFISNPELQALRISGVFSLEHPDITLNNVQAVLGLKQTRLGEWWVVLHR